jgi:DUF917 family protein
LNLTEVLLLGQPIGVVRREELNAVVASSRAFAPLVATDRMLLGQEFANCLEEIRFNECRHGVWPFGVARDVGCPGGVSVSL